MGYKKVPVIHTLEFDGEREGLVVRMKSLKIGDMRKIVKAMEDDDTDTAALLDVMVQHVAKGLVSWNMEDEDGSPIPATMDEVDQLDFDDLRDIMDKWLEKVSGPGPELGKDSNSGASFPGQPLTMEAL